MNVESRQESFEERKDKSNNSISDLYLVEKDDASVSSKSSSKSSSLHTMGPLIEDFLFLEKIAFSPKLLKDMLGNIESFIYKKKYFKFSKMWSTRERGVGQYLEQVEIKYSKYVCHKYLLPAMDGVSFLKVRSSFWETSGENMSNSKEMK